MLPLALDTVNPENLGGLKVPESGRHWCARGRGGYYHYFSIRWWRTIPPVVFTGGGLNLDTRMLIALVVGVVAMTLLYLVLLSLRSAVEAGQRKNAVLLHGLEEREE